MHVENSKSVVKQKKVTSVKRELKTIICTIDNLTLQPKPAICTNLNPRPVKEANFIY